MASVVISELLNWTVKKHSLLACLCHYTFTTSLAHFSSSSQHVLGWAAPRQKSAWREGVLWSWGLQGLVCLQEHSGRICKLNGLCSPTEAGWQNHLALWHPRLKAACLAEPLVGLQQCGFCLYDENLRFFSPAKWIAPCPSSAELILLHLFPSQGGPCSLEGKDQCGLNGSAFRRNATSISPGSSKIILSHPPFGLWFMSSVHSWWADKRDEQHDGLPHLSVCLLLPCNRAVKSRVSALYALQVICW